MQVVDLGTKLGNAITEFRRKGQMYFGDDVLQIDSKKCLGVDLQEKYQNDVEGQGYNFLALDVTKDVSVLPEADYYLAWDFLEHLPSVEWSRAVLQTMLHRARKGVWVRMPSFEPDEVNGEGVLRKLGLRFTWTNWKGHPAHFLLEHCRGAIKDWEQGIDQSISVDVRAGKKIHNTDHKLIVPIDSPVDTVRYRLKLGSKPVVKLDPPVVGQWEVLIKMLQE